MFLPFTKYMVHGEEPHEAVDGVPARQEDQHSSRLLQGPEVTQQSSYQLKGDSSLWELADGILCGQGVGLPAEVQVLLWTWTTATESQAVGGVEFWFTHVYAWGKRPEGKKPRFSLSFLCTRCSTRKYEPSTSTLHSYRPVALSNEETVPYLFQI